MNSHIFVGHVYHERFRPIAHKFSYPLSLYSLDVDEIHHLSKTVSWFGYNRFNIASLYDEDYLWGSGSIRQRVEKLLMDTGVEGKVDRIQLVTSLRHFGYAFNPVSFHFCYDAPGDLMAVIAEVNNTFGEKHPYVLAGADLTYQQEKEFHVSPFNNMQGSYVFRFGNVLQELSVRITLRRDGQEIMVAQLTGRKKEFSEGIWADVLLSAPFTKLRIIVQAARLYLGKKLTYHPKPIPRGITMRFASLSWLEKLARKMILSQFSKIKQGTLVVRFPDHHEERYGKEGPEATLLIRDEGFFTKTLFGGGVGFGEAYTKGEWESPDPVALISLLIYNLDQLDDRKWKAAILGRLKDRLYHVGRRNTKDGSQKNISEHYDLSNVFFQTFLDPTMLYSCGIFKTKEDSLEQAQRNKMEAMIKKARIEAHHHVLEIGSGWGGFAIEAVKSTGCKVTTITLSIEQQRLAKERIEEAGLSDKIDVQLIDYRELQGRFDRIISIEMLEAVGHDYLGDFFASCDRLLAKDGLVAIQVITIPDQRYETYRHSVDWIRRYIFPGGHLPSLTAMCEAMTKQSQFMMEEMENIGPHYAKTLHLWREAFEGSKEQVLSLGFDEEFCRTWAYYLIYCEAGFATRILNTLQFVLTRPSNQSLPHP